MSENHDAEEPAERRGTHQKGDQNGPPKHGARTFLFFGIPASTVGSVFAAVAQKSNMHGKIEKIIKITGGSFLNFTD
jgi:hypothetical protein